jgi:hypothetical protein
LGGFDARLVLEDVTSLGKDLVSVGTTDLLSLSFSLLLEIGGLITAVEHQLQIIRQRYNQLYS